jgi:hypothetical protein
MLAEAAGAEKLQLREMQVIAGRMQRAILTLPVGAACLLVGLFTLMAGLKMPWHTRRTNKGVRDDFRWLHRLLQLNMGKGFYSLANFGHAPECRTDASKSNGYAGGGWVSKCGRYSFFQYGSRAARHLIDHLEGDTVVDCVLSMMGHWKNKVVRLGIDSMAFQRSLAKFRSKAPRLNTLVRELFALQVQGQFILDSFWLSSEDNLLADHLSRNREYEFLMEAVPSGFWSVGTLPLRYEGAGRVRRLPELRGVFNAGSFKEAQVGDADQDKFKPLPPNDVWPAGKGRPLVGSLRLRGAGPEAASSAMGAASSPEPAVVPRLSQESWEQVSREYEEFLMDMAYGPTVNPAPPAVVQPVVQPVPHSVHFAWDTDPYYFEDEPPLTSGMRLRGGAPGTHNFNSHVPYSRASLFQGLPPGALTRLEQVLDNRLSDSSWRTLKAGLKKWRLYVDSQGWEPVIPSDDPDRGGKLVGFVLSLMDETDLVYASIEHYVWGVRTWMKLQHQLDPVYGVDGWRDFMESVKVLTWEPHEPRKQTPLDVVEAMLDACDDSDFGDVQLKVLILTLLYTFSRSECPCPKSYTGREAFQLQVHWGVQDFDIRVVLRVKRVVAVRFWRIKQDRRVERPEAQGEGDWSYVAEIPGSKWCLLEALVKLNSMHEWPRDTAGPMFVTRPGPAGKPYLYRHFLKDYKNKQLAVGVPPSELSGPSGLRTLGYMRCKRGLGVDLTTAHGRWSSSAHERYDRFSMQQVVRIAGVVAGVDPGDQQDPGEREARPPDRLLLRGPGDDAREESAGPNLPTGWVEAEPEGEDALEGASFATGCYFGPDGQVASSVEEAWRLHSAGSDGAGSEDEGLLAEHTGSELEGLPDELPPSRSPPVEWRRGGYALRAVPNRH